MPAQLGQKYLDICPLLILLQTAIRCPMAAWELSSVTKSKSEERYHCCFICISNPAYAYVSVLLRISQLSTQAGNRQVAKKKKKKVRDMEKYGTISYILQRSVLVLPSIVSKVGIAKV